MNRALGLTCLAFGALALPAAAQPELFTSEPGVGEAIARLDAPGFDRDALIAVIDAGEAAVVPLVEAMDAAVRAERGPTAERFGRALRAIGVSAAQQNAQMLAILRGELAVDPEDWHPALDELVETLIELVWLAPELLPTLRESIDDLDDPLVTGLRVRVGRHDKRFLRLAHRITIPADADDPNRPAAYFHAETLLDRELAAIWAPHRADRSAVSELVTAIHAESQPTTCMARFERGMFAIGETSEGARDAIREAASRALARIDPDHPDAALGLAFLATQAPDPRERVVAMVALGQRGDALAEEQAVLDLLYRALADDSDRRLLAETITTCGAVGVRGTAFRMRLQHLADGDDPELAARARSVLNGMDRR